MSSRPESVIVTSAGLSGTDERQARIRRYLLTQSARGVCFILAVALPVPIWAKLLLLVGAIVLPWMGVMAANAGPAIHRDRGENAMVDRLAPFDDEPVRLQLDPARTIDQD